MPVRYVRNAPTAHPTGDPNFAVKQCMPGAIPEDESDPFLMCDEFGPTASNHCGGVDSDDGFDVAWHPHHGMEILSYMVEGRGRHADSLGNREIFDSPGFQWLSVGSGIEHAEGGGTPLGEQMHGFQIWLRMPTENMEDDPRYGIVNPSEIPIVKLDRGLVRVVAGPLGEVVGPAKYAVTVQILDVDLEGDAEWSYECPENMDNVIFYAFKGDSTINGKTALRAQQTCRFDTSGPKAAYIKAGRDGFRGLVFAGKMTKEKIVWHGPFVCSSQANLKSIFRQYQLGSFPPKRVSWDYRNISKKPK